MTLNSCQPAQYHQLGYFKDQINIHGLTSHSHYLSRISSVVEYLPSDEAVFRAVPGSNPGVFTFFSNPKVARRGMMTPSADALGQ